MIAFSNDMLIFLALGWSVLGALSGFVVGKLAGLLGDRKGVALAAIDATGGAVGSLAGVWLSVWVSDRRRSSSFGRTGIGSVAAFVSRHQTLGALAGACLLAIVVRTCYALLRPRLLRRHV